MDLRELLDLLESAEDDLLEAGTPVPTGLDQAIDLLHKDIHKDG